MTDHTAPASQLWLVRHGETEWSASGRHTSRTDLDLTEAGVESARSVAEKLRGTSFARVLSSPLLRARRTAELAGAGSPELVEDLREWDYGDDEGLTTAQIRESRPGWTVWRDGPQGGETCAEVGVRADRVIELVRAVDAPVLAFSHGHFSRVLGARWLGLEVTDGAHLTLSTASVSVLGWERDTPAVLHWNHTGTLC
ncbi:MAG TPA: histidine phosphatase family protein [Mycobacteriales bacterium]|nr:histidine phosphatase family protein [Mycobacteriales bacterium]